MDTMTSAEIAEWQAYDRVHPFGSEKVVEMIGELCALMFNMNRQEGVRATARNEWTGAWRPKPKPVFDDDEALQMKINTAMMKFTKVG